MLKVLQVIEAYKRPRAIKSVFLQQVFPKDLPGSQPKTSLGKFSSIVAHLSLKRVLCCFHAVIYRNGLWLGPPNSLPDWSVSGAGMGWGSPWLPSFRQ